jgi:sterol 24-C-methyltransferase
MMPADTRVPDRIDAYAKFWQKDSAADSQTDTDNRLTHYEEVVNGLCLVHAPRCSSFRLTSC